MSLFVDHSRPGGRTRVRKAWIAIAIVIVVMIGARIALAPVLLHFVNRKLNEIPEYRGRIADVDISLWRGAYRIKDVSLEKISGKIPVPFFQAKVVDISLEWRALLHRKVVSEIEIFQPEINFVKGPSGAATSKEQSQTTIDSSWTTKVKDLAPFDINHFRIHEGQIHFRDYYRNPKVDMHLDHLEAEALGLTNAKSGGDSLPAAFRCTCRVMDHAQYKMEIKLDPLADQPTFDLNGELRGLKLTSLNDFFRAYANIDVEAGSFSLFTEAAAAHGRFKGYVKPIIRDMKILNLKKDIKSPAKLFWEGLVAGVHEILENKSEKQVATQVPFSGSFSNPKAGIWPTVGALLRNAFVRALRPSLSQSIDIKDVGGVKSGGSDKPKPKSKSK